MNRCLNLWCSVKDSTVVLRGSVRKTLVIVLSVAIAGCGGIDISWRNESQVHTRTGPGDIPIPEFRVRDCGVVTINAAITGTGGEFQFEFAPVTPPPEGCCESYGWIQHVDRARAWTFDNGAGGLSVATGVRYGHPSDPTQNPQPVRAANPWYGGPGNVTDAMNSVPDDWDESPRPQSTIRDTPGCNESHAYITELVCVDTGSVLFEYRWRLQPRDGGCEFHGAEGNNISFGL